MAPYIFFICVLRVSIFPLSTIFILDFGTVPVSYSKPPSEYSLYSKPSPRILYYTNINTDTVTGCDLHGTTQWEFKDTRVLHYPYSISVDNDGNVYVVGFGIKLDK
jgi:hypothetical protein